MAAKKARKKTKKAPSAAQIAWRKKFAAKVKAGAFKKAAKKRRALGRKSPAKKRNSILSRKELQECTVNRITGVKSCKTLNPKRRQNKTVIKAKRVTILNLKRNPSFEIHKTLKATKRGNQAGWLLGKKFYAKARGQKALPGNSILDLNSGLVYQRVANPKRRKKNIAGFMQDGVFHPIRSGVEQRTVKGKKRLVKSKKAYKPSKVGEARTYSAKKSAKRAAQSKRMAAATKQRKATTSRLASRSLQRSVPLKGKRRNPESATTQKAREQFKEFHGYDSKRDLKLYYPQGHSPVGPGVLGDFHLFRFPGGGSAKPKVGKVYLVRDTRGKLHLGIDKKTLDKTRGRLTDLPKGRINEITSIEYIAQKPHLGDPHKTIYFHKAGEENGILPSLYSDGDGGLLIKGGDYYITPEGIRN